MYFNLHIYNYLINYFTIKNVTACTIASTCGLLSNKDTKLKRRREKGVRGAAKALVVSEPIVIFYPGDRKS